MNFKNNVMLLSVLWLAFLAGIILFFLPNCSNNPSEPEPPVEVPPDTVIVVDTLIIVNTDTIFLICDTVDMTIEFTVIGDQSAPNVYAYFRNGIEIGRFATGIYAEPTEVTFQVVFERIVFGEVILIKKIQGSRAEAIGSAIVAIRCSEES